SASGIYRIVCQNRGGSLLTADQRSLKRAAGRVLAGQIQPSPRSSRGHSLRARRVSQAGKRHLVGSHSLQAANATPGKPTLHVVHGAFGQLLETVVRCAEDGGHQQMFRLWRVAGSNVSDLDSVVDVAVGIPIENDLVMAIQRIRQMEVQKRSRPS